MSATSSAQCSQPDLYGCFEHQHQHLNNHSMGDQDGLKFRWPPTVWQEMGMKFNAIHMALIPTPPLRGKILAWDYGKPDGERNSPGTQRWSIIDPELPPTDRDRFANFTLNIANLDPQQTNDIACCGFTWLPDGRLLIVGGTEKYLSPGLGPTHIGGIVGARLVYTFDPALWDVNAPNVVWQKWPGLSPLDRLLDKRYYPSAMLGNDRWVYVARGNTDDSNPNQLVVRDDFEMVLRPNLSGQGALLERIRRPGPDPSLENGFAILLIYPRGHLVSNGQLFWAGMEQQAVAMLPPNPPTPGAWPWTVKSPSGHLNRFYGTAALFPNIDPKHTDAYIIIGGAVFDPDLLDPAATYAIDTAQICKASASNTMLGFHDVPQGTQWTPLPPLAGSLPTMAQKRAYLNAVVLPDGGVLVIGGTRNGGGNSDFVREAECLKGGQWQQLASMQANRGYHQTALLLPSGKILIAAGEGGRIFDYEVFSPPYIYKSRPQWETGFVMTANVNYGGYYQVRWQPMAPGQSLSKIVLMRPGCCTHHFDTDQRYYQIDNFELPIGGSGNSASFQLPTNVNALPAGYYMVFLVTNDGVPSEAQWTRVVGQ